MSEHAGGADEFQVSYDDGTGNRTVTGPLGNAETYKFTYYQGVPKVTEIDRAASSPVAAASRYFTYDTNGYLASATDWDGNTTNYTNNSHGQPTEIVEGYGSGVARTTDITYDSTWVHKPYGTNTPPGSSVASYLQSQAAYRSSTVYYIPTTTEQDAAALSYLQSQPTKLGPAPIDNCSTRTNDALSSAGFYDTSNPYASALSAGGIASSAPLPMTSMPESTQAIAKAAASASITIPAGTPASAPLYNDPILRTFEPSPDQ